MVINKQSYLPLLKLFKKATFHDVKIQRNRGQVMTITPIVKKLVKEKNTDNFFCTGDIENIDEVINIYESYNKKILLEWPICPSTDILRTIT